MALNKQKIHECDEWESCWLQTDRQTPCRMFSAACAGGGGGAANTAVDGRFEKKIQHAVFPCGPPPQY